MVRARVTSKGQVTLPVEIRRRLRVQPGDEIDFDTQDGAIRGLPLHRRRLSEFAGILRATRRSHASLEEIRKEVGRKLGEDLDRRLRRR